jgi:hypothetical protein
MTFAPLVKYDSVVAHTLPPIPPEVHVGIGAAGLAVAGPIAVRVTIVIVRTQPDEPPFVMVGA